MKFPPPHLLATVLVAITSMKSWRRDPESNRTNRICNPVSAVGTYSVPQSNQRLAERIQRVACSICVQLAKKTPPLVAGLAVASALTACGGGGSSVAPTPAPPQAAQIDPQEPYLISAYGDSTQEAQGNPHAASAPGAKVYNRGVGGTNTAQLLAGTDGRNYVWPEMMRAESAKIIVINHGINDRGYPLEVYKANLRELVEVAQKAGKIVILEEPNPVSEVETELMAAIKFDVPAFEERRAAMKALAAHMGVYHCDQPRVPLDDGIHPTVQGYVIKASRLKNCLKDLMG